MTEETKLRGRKLVLIELDSGEQVYVSPISPVLLRAIVRNSEERFPYPDEASYRLPLPDAAIPGDLMPAAQNPDYQKLKRTVDMERMKYQNDSLALIAVRDAPLGRSTLIEKYRDEVETWRRVADFPVDEWEATVSVLVTTREDFDKIVRVATESIPITLDELRDGMAIFRLEVSKQADSMVVRAKGSRRAATE